MEDSGIPRMKSEHTIVVIVTDQNDSPSTPRAVHVIVYSFNSETPLGKIADVHPNDPDITGAFSCKILQGSSLNVLSIPTACDLHTNKISSGTFTYQSQNIRFLEIYKEFFLLLHTYTFKTYRFVDENRIFVILHLAFDV